MNKNRRKIAMIAVLAVIFSTFLGTIAYLTSETEVKKNVFTIGRIENPRIEEYNWNEEEALLLPKKNIKKDPYLVFGPNTIDSYAYVAVKSNLIYGDRGQEKDAIVYHGLDKNKWTLIENEVLEEESIVYIYRYKDIVSGENVEKKDRERFIGPLFYDVKLEESMTADEIDQLIDLGEEHHTVEVKGFMHQAYGDDKIDVSQIDGIAKNIFLNKDNW